MLYLTMRKPCLIGIAGPSGAGKSRLAEALAERLSAPILSLDSYYREYPDLPFAERARINFDEPAALDSALLLEQLACLAQGGEIAVPVYDFATHNRVPERILLRAGECVILEGLFTLYWEEIRALLAVKVFVATGDDVCYGRRLERDTRERGRSPESVRWQYDTTVRPMAERYVLPSRQFADVVVSGTAPLERSAAVVLARVQLAQTVGG